MKTEQTFGKLVKARRQELGLTQDELARRVGCASVTVRKIEYDDLRPSVQIAERLAMSLNIPLEERAAFVRLARADRPPDPPPPTPTPAPEEIGIEDLTGRAIRGYALGELVGHGGMGVVYRAIQPLVEREVAVKIILPQYANHTEFIRRFEAEAQLVARLEHPHIVPLYDYWRQPNTAFLVMRLLRGGSLRDVLETGPLPVDLAVRFLEQVGSALGAAHRAGVIHRDLKPANILLDEDQNAYLADFGIAKNLSNPNPEDQTQIDAVIGSPDYISPEQIRSEFVRPQTDIYCLGVVLYELLTGQVPFQGPTPIEIMSQHLNAPLPPLAAHRIGLPGALDVVIEHATAKDPLERYEDVESMLADMRQAVYGSGDWVTDNGQALAIMIPATGRTLSSIDNPYKGLRAFSEGDAQDFFGREALAQQLLTQMGEGGDLSRFLAVVGPSGSGKSSVVKAGLIPALRRGGLPGSENWFILDLLPGAHPFEEIETALLRIAINPPVSLLNQLREDTRGVLRAVRRCLPEDPAVELVLVIDQFEEVFTLLPDEGKRAHLLDSLVAAVLDERSRLRIVITLRADFTDRPLNYVDFGELIRQRMEVVLPLTPDELESAITGPAQRVGLHLEPGLVATIIRDVGDQPGSLPLLQYALTELFEKRAGNALTKKAYAEIGGVLGALGRRAEEIYAGLDAPAQTAARQIFLRLVTLGEGVEDTRRRVLKTELEGLTTREGRGNMEPGIPSPKPRHPSSIPGQVIDTFGKARLLTFDRDPVTRGPTVEVAHEALLREWPRLRGWLMDSRADIRMQRTLFQTASEWVNANRDPGLFLRGTRLNQMESWATDTTLALTVDEQAFLEASLEARQERQSTEAERQEHERVLEQRARRFLRGLVGVFAAAAVIAFLLSVYAFNQRGVAEAEAHVATSRELAAASIAAQSTDPDLSILLALQALVVTRTLEAENALHQAILASPVEMTLEHEGGSIDLAYSPDGARLTSAGVDGSLKIFDAASGEELLHISAHAVDINGVAFSPDGTRVASASLDGTAILWDAGSGERLLTLEGHTGWVVGTAFSPDGSQLVTAGHDGKAILWDTDTGQELLALDHGEEGVSSAVFSSDGTRLVTASNIQFGAGPGAIRIWDVATGAELWSQAGRPFFGVAFNPDGTRLAAEDVDGGLSVWNVEDLEGEDTAQPLFTVFGIASSSTTSNVIFTPDGNRLLSLGEDQITRMWDAGTGRELNQFICTPANPITLSPDGRHLAVGGDNGAIKICSLEPSQELLTLTGHTDWVGGVTFSQDGSRLYSLSWDGTVKAWNLATENGLALGQELLTLDWQPKFKRGGVDIEISPDGSLLVIAAHNEGFNSWDLRTGRAIIANQPGETHANRIAFSPDGKQLAVVASNGMVRIFDVRTGRELLEFDGHGPEEAWGVDYSSDGKYLATGGADNMVKVWDPATGQLLKMIEQTGTVATVVFTPDGRYLVSGGVPGISLWDLQMESGEPAREVRRMFGYTGFAFDLAFSPDGQRLASASFDVLAQVWDLNSGQELLSLSGHSNTVLGVAFSPDGRYLATASMDGTVRISILDLDELIDLARSRVTRWWTPEECRRYLHVETCPPKP